MISKDHPKMSVVKQCEALEINRSGLYYNPKGESELNLKLMRLIDEQYLKYPFMGADRMHTWLTKDKGFKINKKRIERLYYKTMGLRTLMPGVKGTRNIKSTHTY